MSTGAKLLIGATVGQLGVLAVTVISLIALPAIAPALLMVAGVVNTLAIAALIVSVCIFIFEKPAAVAAPLQINKGDEGGMLVDEGDEGGMLASAEPWMRDNSKRLWKNFKGPKEIKGSSRIREKLDWSIYE